MEPLKMRVILPNTHDEITDSISDKLRFRDADGKAFLAEGAALMAWREKYKEMHRVLEAVMDVETDAIFEKFPNDWREYTPE